MNQLAFDCMGAAENRAHQQRQHQSTPRRRLWNAAGVALATAIVLRIAGCAVTSEPVTYEFDGAKHQFNAKVNGMDLTATVFLDGRSIISHTWPPFVNSRDEQVAQVDNHEVRSVLRIIKGLGNTTAQVYVYVDGEQIGTFYF